MRKKLIVTALVIAGLIFAWRIAYGLQKHTDNLPPLSTIAEMSESDVNSLLPGYQLEQLVAVWGEPDFSEDNTAVWETEGVTLTVNYKNNGLVAVCGLKDAKGNSVGEN